MKEPYLCIATHFLGLLYAFPISLYECMPPSLLRCCWLESPFYCCVAMAFVHSFPDPWNDNNNFCVHSRSGNEELESKATTLEEQSKDINKANRYFRRKEERKCWLLLCCIIDILKIYGMVCYHLWEFSPLWFNRLYQSQTKGLPKKGEIQILYFHHHTQEMRKFLTVNDVIMNKNKIWIMAYFRSCCHHGEKRWDSWLMAFAQNEFPLDSPLPLLIVVFRSNINLHQW